MKLTSETKLIIKWGSITFSGIFLIGIFGTSFIFFGWDLYQKGVISEYLYNYFFRFLPIILGLIFLGLVVWFSTRKTQQTKGSVE